MPARVAFRRGSARAPTIIAPFTRAAASRLISCRPPLIQVELRIQATDRGGVTVWKFHIYKDSSSNYRWRLKSSNGQTVASSGESFSSKSAARKAAENVKSSAGRASVVED